MLYAVEQPSSNSETTNLIPRAELFSSPQAVQVSINPEGTHIAYLAPTENGILNIHVSALDDISRPVQYISEKHWPVRSVSWTYNKDILLYSQDSNGDEKTQIFMLNLASGKAISVSDDGCVSDILALSETQPDSLLYSTNNRNPQFFDVWHYDLATQKHSLVFKNDDFLFVVPDNELEIRLAGSLLPSGEMELSALINDSWLPIFTLSADSVASFKFLGFSQDNKSFYFTASKYSDTSMLYQYDTTKQKLTALAQEDSADIIGAYFHPKKQHVEAYIYEYERLHVVPVTQSFKSDWSWLEEQLEGDLSITSRSLNNNKWVIHAFYDNKPSDFLLFDAEKKELTYLFSSRPNIKKYQLEKMYPVIITARDGLKLVSYLTPAKGVTLDTNMKASQHSPLIILVHGGPVGVRDSWGFNPTAQFLANRGYSVLSINYRGSGGFGKSFIEKSFGQWSRSMQDDLLDGVEWAIDHNIAARDQINIMGGSYGGYAALVGLSMTPDVFASGIDIVGPSNLETLVRSIPEYWKPALALLRKKLGLPQEESEKDSALLAEISPITYAHQINKPLLIMHGANDPRVKQAESEQIIAILREKEIPFLYALFPDEGHGFALPENRIASYAIIESFLGDIFHTPVEPINNSLRRSSVIIQGLDD